MLKVGLTGGIATGKSYVLGVFAELGCDVLDADVTARQVVEPGKPALREIIDHFGSEILAPDGNLDRAKLGAVIFNDASQREKLNSIVHPRVYEAQARWLSEVESRNPQAIAIIDAALLIETGSYRRFDKLVVVHCDPQTQLARLMARNQLTSQEAAARMATQMSSAEKLKYANYSIDTSLGFEDTRRKTEAVFLELKEAAALSS